MHNRFKEVALFQGLSDKDLTEVSRHVRTKLFHRNQTILYEDDADGYVYIILDGLVKVMHTTEEGKEVIIAIHKSGDSFGEISMIDGKSSYAAVVAMRDTIVALITKENFLNMLQLHPKMLGNVLQMLCAKFRQSLNPVRILNVKDSLGKVKTLLSCLADNYGKTNTDGVSLDFHLTHQIIADMTGLTRETVTRGMDKLRSDRQIVLDGKTICLRTHHVGGA